MVSPATVERSDATVQRAQRHWRPLMPLQATVRVGIAGPKLQCSVGCGELLLIENCKCRIERRGVPR